MMLRRRLFGWLTTISLLILLVSQLLGSAPFAGASVAYAASKPKAIPAHLTYQQFLNLSRQASTGRKPFHWYQPTTPSPMSKQEQAFLHTPRALPPSAEPPTMRPMTQTLSTAFLDGAPDTPPLTLTSSDHRLTVQIPAGAFDLSHASVSGTNQGHTRSPRTGSAVATPTAMPPTAGGPTATPTATLTPTPTATASPRGPPPVITGPLTLIITEQHGSFIGEMNQSDQYQWQILDARGHFVSGVTLRHSLTIRYHYQPGVLTDLDLDPGEIFFNWPDLAAADRAAHRSTTQDAAHFTNDAATDTLTAQIGVLDNGPFVVSGDPQNQSPPNPNEASVSGNTGQVSYSYPLQLAPAPDGFAPQLALSYSSGNVNERQNVTSPAGDVGDGWTLALGAITAAVYPSSSSGGSATWYSISGVDGISDRLVPDPSHSGWYLTQHLSYLRIQQVTANNELCFHVWDQSDTYYQFGCSPDSLQYRYDGSLHLYQWDLNEMVAPNDGSTSTFKNIVVKYFQDCGASSGNCPQASNATGSDAIRDAAIEQIQYGIGSQPGTISTISGAVDFYYWAPNAPSGSQWAIPYTTSFNGTSYACDGTPPENTHNMRCDDPQPDADDPGSAPPPTVMSTLTLLSVTSYVGNDSGTGSFPAYQYQFKYTDTPLSECVDPLSQVQETCAGDHVLDSVTPFVYKHGAANQLQPLLLDYTTLQDGYYDTTQTVPGGNHYDIKTNWMYLADEYDSNTGIGEHLDYNTAYNNSHGTPADIVNGVVIDNRLDPLFCPNHLGGSLDCWNYGTKQFAYPDDRAWTTQVVIDRKSFGVDSSAMSQAETTYAYVLKVTNPDDPSMCPDDGTGDTNCPGDNWLPKNDNDWQDYYHGQFQGFNFVNTVSPAGELTQDNYFSTDGWNSSSNFPNNAFAGDLTEEDIYQGNSASDPLLSDLTNNYGGLNKTTPPCDAGVTGPYDPCEPIIYSSVVTTYNGSTSPNPPTETTSYSYDDYNPPGSQQSNWALSISGNYHHLLEETITGSNTDENSASNSITNLWTYTVNDSGYNPSGWYFYDVNKIAHSEIDDSANPMRKWDCQAFTYDEGSGSPTPEAGWPTTVSAYTSANCNPGNFTTPLTTSYTGYDALGDVVATVDPLGVANQSFYGGTGLNGKNGCTLNTAPAFMSSAWSKSRYTTCITYDPTYNALPTTTTNAFSQTASTSYDAQMGELPKAVTDPNGQVTSYNYSYDNSGNRTVQVTEPEPQNAYTSQSVTNSSCASSIPTGATTPCFAIDSNEAEYPTAVTETFYDGLGRQVETRAPGPTSGDDTIQFTVYNDQAHTSFTSVPFEVTAGSGWIDPATAKDKNGYTPAGTMTYYDALGRVIAVDDPIFTKGTGIWCPSISADATACTVYKLDSPQGSSTLYETEKDIDPNNHVMEAFTDAMGRTAAIQEYSGTNGNGLTPIQQISYQYDALAQPTQVTTIDLAPQSGQTVSSVTATMSYDDLGRLTQLVDPDRGTHSYTYDPDGNVLNDTSGSRTIGYNDDLLGRIGCVQDGTAVSDADGSCTGGTNVLVQNTYDTTEIGTQGTNDFPIGRLTKTQATTYYPEGGSLQSTEKYQYDQRGRVTTEQLKFNLPNTWNLTLPTYQLTENYTDADQPLTTQTSTLSPNGNGYTFSEVYDQTLGVLTGLSSTTNTTTPDLATVSYTVNALLGSLNFNTSGGVGSSLATENFSYDGDLRPTEESATWQSGSGRSGTLFDNAQGYDPASNVDTVTTSISKPNGQSGSDSETQNFCYDEQNQLMWAGNSGTQPAPGNGTCGGGTLANSFPNASYATSFSYTNLGQLWQGPLGGTGSSEQYLYCNSQPHQVSDIVPAGQGYTCSNLPSSIPYAVKYDAWGNVTSRSYNNQTATLSYNKLDEMVEWQVPSVNQAWYAYDANGERTLERSTVGSTTTETVYAFGLEEYSYDSSGTLTSSTHYYSLAGHLIGEVQGSSTNVFLTDALGSVQAVISNTESSAALLSNQVFAPYGTPLSHNGNQISQYTNKGFTGQYNDPTSGLDYYVSRYYDSVSGVFLSADTVAGNPFGMNPYGYAGNNPETNNDPTGQAYIPPGGGGGGGSGGSGGSGGIGGGGSGGGCDEGCGGNSGGNSNWGNISFRTPQPPAIRKVEQQIVQEAEQAEQWAIAHPSQTLQLFVGAALTIAGDPEVGVPMVLGVVGFALAVWVTTTVLSSNYGPTPTPGSDITLPQAANSQIEGHSTATPTPALTGSGDGGAKKPPTKPTASPPDEPSGGNEKGRSSSPDFQKGVEKILEHYNDFTAIAYDLGYDPTTFKFVDVSDFYPNNDPELTSNEFYNRYYFRFQTARGIVRVSADYNPGTGEWNDSFARGIHLSSTQESPFWQQEYDIRNNP